MIDADQLVACGIDRDVAKQFELPLDAAMTAFAINTPKRAAAFLAQAAHESNEFTRLQENLSYSTPERLMEVFKGRFTGLADAAQYLRQPETGWARTTRPTPTWWLSRPTRRSRLPGTGPWATSTRWRTSARST